MSFNPELRSEHSGPETSAVDTDQVVLAGLTGYINAGGRGVRLSSIFPPHERRGVSKALLTVGEPPITLIEHQINKMDHAGVPTIVAGVGDHDNVAEHIGAVYAGRSNIYAAQHRQQLGTGGDLVRTVRERPELFAEDVLIVCADTLLDIDEADFLTFHRDMGGELSIALTRNKGVPNEGAFYVGSNCNVMHCAEADWNDVPLDVAAEKCDYRGSSTGAMIASRDMLLDLAWQPEDGPLPLDRTIVASVIAKSGLFAYDNGHRLFTDVGTVTTWDEAQHHPDTIMPYIHYADPGRP